MKSSRYNKYICRLVLILFLDQSSQAYYCLLLVYFLVIDSLYQGMEKRERDPYRLMDNARFLNREGDWAMNKYTDGQSYRDLRKKGPDEKTKGTNTLADTWNIEAVDTPKYFTNFYSRAIAVDANGHPHIAYGGEHLYHAYYKWA